MAKSLAKLAESMTSEGKEKIKTESKIFILKHGYFCKAYFSLSKTDQEWILEYMCSGKGVIPYEMIKSFDSLNIRPADGEFFSIEGLYSSLKDYIISEEEYASVRNFYTFDENEKFSRPKHTVQFSRYDYFVRNI